MESFEQLARDRMNGTYTDYDNLLKLIMTEIKRATAFSVGCLTDYEYSSGMSFLWQTSMKQEHKFLISSLTTVLSVAKAIPISY